MPRMTRQRAILLLVIGLVTVPIVAALATHFGQYLTHVLSYTGVCGPHATDIPAHPCTREQYANEFGAGFAFLGVLLFDILGLVGALVAFVVGWVIYYVRLQRRLHRTGSSHD